MSSWSLMISGLCLTLKDNLTPILESSTLLLLFYARGKFQQVNDL